MVKDLPLATQSLYSELLERLLIAPGSYTGMTVFCNSSRGKDYWYFEYTLGKSKNRLYLGPDSPEMRTKVEKFKDNKEKSQQSARELKKIVSTLAAAGYQSVTAREFRVFEVLSQAEVFSAGSVVVGSHAFGMIGNMMGVQFEPSIVRTDDIDIANDFHIQIGVPDHKKTMHAILKQADQGFLEVPTLNRKHPSTSFSIRNANLRVDVLAPMYGKTDSKPRKLKSINAMAAPVRFLDYLLMNAQPAVVLGGAGVIVHIPNPAHFALHKLVISQRRPAAQALKAKKDLGQAQAVLSEIYNTRPGDLHLAYADVTDMQKKFQMQLIAGASMLPPALFEKIEADLQEAVHGEGAAPG